MELPNILDCGHVEWVAGTCATMTCKNYVEKHRDTQGRVTPLRKWTPIETLNMAVVTRRAEVELKIRGHATGEALAYKQGMIGAFSEVLELMREIEDES